ncbi:hypothetical protein GS416_03900 [Rhodococcus hoagii]|nr:hypothetical protein [Prescottella equi]
MVEVTELGRELQRVTVILSRGSTWEVALTPVTFPAGTTVTLAMGDRTFPATVTADRCRGDSALSTRTPSHNSAQVRVHCLFPDTPNTYAGRVVERHGAA